MANHVSRRSFIGGSDARIIMDRNETALFRLWREKRGEIEPADLVRESGVSLATIHRAESVDGKTAMTFANASAIRRALENAGVELIEENGGGPGARLKRRLG